MLLSDIIHQLGGQLTGQDQDVTAVASLDLATSCEISFLSNPKYHSQLQSSQAGAIIVHEKMRDKLPQHVCAIVVDDPYLYFAQVAKLFTPPVIANGKIHTKAVVADSAIVPSSCEIGANAVIGDGVVLGERCRILAGTVIEENCQLGNDVCLHANVTVYPNVVIGNRVEIHSGAVIGADGFGLAWDKGNQAWFKIPQTGRVVLEDDVEIGANSTVDRGAINDTVIKQDAKIDNLVQIAHNVHIGSHTAIAGCTGIAGSTHIGDNCTIGGAAMFVGHIEVADRTFIGGGTLVSHSIKEAGHYASSYPLQTHKDWVRNAVHVRRLNDMSKRLKALEAEGVAPELDMDK